MTIPPPPALPPEPVVAEMSVSELQSLIEAGNVYRAKAVFELVARARADEAAAVALGQLSRMPMLRNDRLDGYVSLAWAAIIGLLADETPRSRQIAYDAFAALDPPDRELFLTYVRADRIDDAHPQL
jgi:hypothetical protein